MADDGRKERELYERLAAAETEHRINENVFKIEIEQLKTALNAKTNLVEELKVDQDLEKKIAALTTSVNKLQSEKKRLINESSLNDKEQETCLEELKTLNDGLRSQLKSALEENESLKSQIKTIDDSVKQIECLTNRISLKDIEMKEIIDENKKLRKEKDATNLEEKQFKDEVSKMSKKLKSNEILLNEKLQQIRQLILANNELQENLSKSRSLVTSLGQVNQELIGKHHKLVKDKIQSKTENEGMLKGKEELYEIIQEQESHIKDLQKEVMILQKTVKNEMQEPLHSSFDEQSSFELNLKGLDKYSTAIGDHHHLIISMNKQHSLATDHSLATERSLEMNHLKLPLIDDDGLQTNRNAFSKFHRFCHLPRKPNNNK